MSLYVQIPEMSMHRLRRPLIAGLSAIALSPFCHAQSNDPRTGTLPASPWNYRSSVVAEPSIPLKQESAKAFVRQPRSGSVKKFEVGQSSLPPSILLSPSDGNASQPVNQPSLMAPVIGREPLNMLQGVGKGIPTPEVDSERSTQSRAEGVPTLPEILPVPESIPAPTPMQKESIRLTPAYPEGERNDNNSPVANRTPYPFEFPSGNSTQQDANNVNLSKWESLPRNGLVVEPSPFERNGLPDRSASATMTPASNSKSVDFVPQRPISRSEYHEDDPVRIAAEHRHRLSSQVSRDILTDVDVPSESRPTPIEPPQGWQATERELREHLVRCDDLLRRGATHSARQETLIAIRLLLRSLDQRRAEWMSEPYFDQALIAFREEADFHASIHSPEHSHTVESLVRGHQTPVLKSTQLSNLAPGIAAQYYRHFAKDRLIAAAESHKWGAELYYALGKCFEKEAQESEIHKSLLLGQAATCYQAAIATDPKQPVAANQLGFVLLQLDRNQEAEMYIHHSLQSQPSPAAYKNLAELYRRRGDQGGVDWANHQVASLQLPIPQNAKPFVQEVDPATFAQYSPKSVGPTGQPQPTSQQPAPPLLQAGVSQQPSGSSWMGRLFR